ncbi:MAG: hypothetical protein ABIM36_03485 [candidate division WOR-3 bacterium]
MRPTDILKSEHRIIERMLTVLEKALILKDEINIEHVKKSKKYLMFIFKIIYNLKIKRNLKGGFYEKIFGDFSFSLFLYDNECF